MKHIWIILCSCILGMVLALTHEHDIWGANLYLAKRTNTPPGKYSQSGRIPQLGKLIKTKEEKPSSSSQAQKLASAKLEEAQVTVDVHGPGRFSGMPTLLGNSYQNHVEGGKRQSQTYRGSQEVFAKGISHPVPINQDSRHTRSMQNMVKVEAKGRKVEQLVTAPGSGIGKIEVFTPGEHLPVNIPVLQSKGVKVTAQTPDPRGMTVTGTVQRGGEADATARNTGSIDGHKIRIDKSN